MDYLIDFISDFLNNVDFTSDTDLDNIVDSLQESGVDLTQYTPSEIREVLEEALNSEDLIKEELQYNDEADYDTSDSNNQETDYDSKTNRGQVNFGSSVIGHDSLHNPIFSTTVETQSVGSTILMTNDPMNAMMNPHPSPEDAVKTVVKADYQNFVDDAKTSFEKQQREIIRENASNDAANVETFLQKVNRKFHQ